MPTPLFSCASAAMSAFPGGMSNGHENTELSSRGARMQPWGASGPVRSRPRANCKFWPAGGDHQIRGAARQKPSNIIVQREKKEYKKRPMQLDLPSHGSTFPSCNVQMLARSPCGEEGDVSRKARRGPLPAHTRMQFGICGSPRLLGQEGYRSRDPDCPPPTTGAIEKRVSLPTASNRKRGNALEPCEEEGVIGDGAEWI